MHVIGRLKNRRWRACWTVWLLSCAGAHAWAGEQNWAAALWRCEDIASNSERLACFDDVMRGVPRPDTPPDSDGAAPIAPVAAAPVAPATVPVEAGTPSAVAPPTSGTHVEPAKDESADFGFEHKAAVRHANPTLSAVVAKVERSAYGNVRVTLDNEQVWQQYGTERLELRTGDRVVLERGTFNSFFLSKQGTDRKIRFTRLR